MIVKSEHTHGLEFDPEAHHYFLMGNRIPSVTQIIEDFGLIDTSFFTEDARQRGSAVHRATHLIDEGIIDWDTVDWRLGGYLRAWERFKNDTGFESIFIEELVASRRLGYAGTLDRGGIFNLAQYKGKTGIIDLKSGVPDLAHAMQISAYDLAMAENKMGRMDFHVILYLHGDGTYYADWIKPDRIIRLKAAWQGLCIAYNDCELIKRRVRKEENGSN